MAPFVEVMRKADYNKLYDEKLNNEQRARQRREERRRSDSRSRRERRDESPRKTRRDERPRSTGSDERSRRRVRKPGWLDRGMGLDLPFLLLVLVLLIIGMIMMFSASYPVAYYEIGDSYFYIKRQLIFALIGIAAMIGLSFFNYNKLHKFVPAFLIITLILLVAVLAVSGKVHRWFSLGAVNIQPSEIAKFTIILFFAHWGSLYCEKMQYAKYSVLPGVAIFGATAGLLIMEPHYSGIVIIGILTVVMLYISGIEVKWLAFGGIVLAGAVFLAWVTGALTYAMERMDGWGQALNPPDELWNATWQTRNSLYAIGSGGLFGLGLGQSRQKYLYLPEPQNDFVFAIVCEELGFVGAVIILIIFALLVRRGITLSLRSKDRFGKLLGIGLSSQIGIQVVLNILVITDWLPNTGISLPFFSYGGSSLIMLLAQMGLILSISRTANIERQ